MDVQAKPAGNLPIIVIFEQPHLLDLQIKIREKAASFNKNEFIVKLNTPNVFNHDSVYANAKLVLIPDTVGAQRQADIKAAYATLTKAKVEVVDFAAPEKPAPPVKSETPDDTWTVPELTEHAAKADPPIDLAGAKKKDEILARINPRPPEK